MGFWRFVLATSAGMAPTCYVCAYLGERAPQYVNVLLAIFGVSVLAAVVAAVVGAGAAARAGV